MTTTCCSELPSSPKLLGCKSKTCGSPGVCRFACTGDCLLNAHCISILAASSHLVASGCLTLMRCVSSASLLLACGVATCRAATVGNEVEILGLAVSQDSIVAHRTDKYRYCISSRTDVGCCDQRLNLGHHICRLHQGFAVRRGQPFTVDVFTADKLAADQVRTAML